MALQACRSSLRRAHSPLCVFAPKLRSYATEPAPESARPADANDGEPPFVQRWRQTPPAMKAPMQMDFAKSERNKIWKVNNSPEMLDQMYDRFLGPKGSKMLPEEVKWLAVTHKSFDQGRRGFNDKLALMGRLTLAMEATKDIITMAPQPGTRISDQFDREPFEHEQLKGIDNLAVLGTKDVVSKEKLYKLARNVGLLEVIRWKPRLTRRLESSGVETVLNGAVYAIIGAVTLQHGAAVASQIVRDRILAKLPKDA